jgi:hypothetical protein
MKHRLIGICYGILIATCLILWMETIDAQRYGVREGDIEVVDVPAYAIADGVRRLNIMGGGRNWFNYEHVVAWNYYTGVVMRRHKFEEGTYFTVRFIVNELGDSRLQERYVTYEDSVTRMAITVTVVLFISVSVFILRRVRRQ